MSASKSSAKKQYSSYKIEQLGDIERLKSICFPKTPKTPQGQSSSSIQSSNNLPTRSFHQQSDSFFKNSSVNVKDIVSNMHNSANSNNNRQRSHDNFYSQLDNNNMNNARSLERKRKPSATATAAAATGSFDRTPTKKKQRNFFGSTSNIKAIAQQSLQLQSRPSFEYPRNSQHHPPAFSSLFATSFTENEGTESNEMHQYLQKINSKQQQQQEQQSRLQQEPGSAAYQMVSFIRRIGCELNDLCLTKIPDQQLSGMIERHLEQVQTVQKSFSDAMLEREPNITAGVELIGECFEDLVEKLGDLITRLRMFKKKKFQNLVEASLTATMREVFEENNHLNLKQIITDIHTFVGNQRKSLYLWRITSLVALIAKKQKQKAYFNILEVAQKKAHERASRNLRRDNLLKKVLSLREAEARQAIQRMFYKWQYKKNTMQETTGRILSGLSKLSFLVDSKQRGYTRDGFKGITQLTLFEVKLHAALTKFTQLVSARFRGCTRLGFEKLKLMYYFSTLHWNPRMLKVKGLAMSSAIESAVLQRKRAAFQVFIQGIQKRECQRQGFLRLVGVVEKQRGLIMKRIVTHFVSESKIITEKKRVGASRLFRIAANLSTQRMRNVLETMREEFMFQSQPTSEVFRAVLSEINRLECPSLRNIFRTVDACFSNKRITRHLTNLRSISFKTINLSTKEIVSLNAIWKKLEWTSLQQLTESTNQTVAVFSDLIKSKKDVFSKGTETIDGSLFNKNQESSSKEKPAIQSIILPLDHILNEQVYLVCETSCAHPMGKQMENKIKKLLQVMHNRLKENFYRERLHLKMCTGIHQNHMKSRITHALATWKVAISDSRIHTEKSEHYEKTWSLEMQLESYKTEIEKDQVNSTNIMKELGMKREEAHEIAARLDDLTIEKKLKSKCLATALFANFIVARESQHARLKRGFSRWAAALGEQKIARVACEQIEATNMKHIESRVSSAAYLLTHFADSWKRALLVDAMKTLACYSVVNGNGRNASQQLNFSRSATPLKSLSPNASFLSRNQNKSSMKQLNPNNTTVLNESTSQNRLTQQQQQQSLSLSQTQNRKQSNSEQQQQQQQQGDSNFRVASLLDAGKSRTLSPNDSTLQKGFFNHPQQQQQQLQQSQNSKQFDDKNASMKSSTLNQGSAQEIVGIEHPEVSPVKRAGIVQQTNSLLQAKELSRRNSLNSSNGGGYQPPLQLQPTLIVDSNPSNQFNSQQQLSQSYNNNNSYSNSFYGSMPQQQRKNSLNSSMNQFHRSPLNNTVIAEQENISQLTQQQQQSAQLSRSMNVGGNTGMQTTPSSGSATKKPSNLSYRLNAKTINFLQKYGRPNGSQTLNQQTHGQNVLNHTTDFTNMHHSNEDSMLLLHQQSGNRTTHHTPLRSIVTTTTTPKQQLSPFHNQQLAMSTQPMQYNQSYQQQQQSQLNVMPFQRNQDGLEIFDQVQTRRDPSYDDQFYRRY